MHFIAEYAVASKEHGIVRRETTPENTTTAPLFPLDQWFDITKSIPISEADLVEAQMALYAIKDGLNPYSSECQQEYRVMRKAVEKHNAQFPPSPPPVPRRKTAKQLAIIKTKREVKRKIREKQNATSQC